MGNISKNFSRAEFEASNTAKKHNIDNTIPQKYEKNLIKLVEQLQIIRDEFNEPIVIGSGYRCDKVNKLVGGVPNSDHRFAAAADIKTTTDTLKHNMKLWKVITKLAKENKIHLRQIIFEYGNKKVGPNWIHVSVNNEYNTKRNNQIVFVGV